MTHDQTIDFLYALPEEVEAITIKGTSFFKVAQTWMGNSPVVFPKPVIWHDRTGQSLFLPGERYTWDHDVTGEKYNNMYLLKDQYPQYASKWADGLFGGNCFESNGLQFKTTLGVRGIDYKAVIAFDKLGNGAVFIQ